MANPIEILGEVLQAAAGVDEFPIVHFERRESSFRVWPRDNGAPFSVAVTTADDEAVAEIERLRALVEAQGKELRELRKLAPGHWTRTTEGES